MNQEITMLPRPQPNRRRGFAMIIAVAFTAAISAMSLLMINAASFEMQSGRFDLNSRLLETTARACAESWAEIARKSVSLAGYGLTNTQDMSKILFEKGRMPQASTLSSQYTTHPIIGDCMVVDSACLDNAADINGDGTKENYCCCRTGPLLDYDNTNWSIYKYNVSANDNIMQGRRRSPSGRLIAHAVRADEGNIEAGNVGRSDRVIVTVTAAAGVMARDFEVLYEYRLPPVQSNQSEGGAETSYDR